MLASAPGLRAAMQDWSTLTLEAFPHHEQELHGSGGAVTRRVVVERGVRGGRTELEMETTQGRLRLRVGRAEDGVGRSWLVRVHLRPGQCVAGATLLLQEEAAAAAAAAEEHRQVAPTYGLLDVMHLLPLPAAASHGFLPFGGAGARPPSSAGAIAELHVPAAAHSRTVDIRVVESEYCAGHSQGQ